MADEARRHVDQQEEQKAAIERLAESTVNASKSAFSEANDAIYGASTTSQQIATLNEQIARASEALNTTRGLAEQENADAQRVYDVAVGALRDVESVRLPDVIPEELGEDAQNQREESSLSLTDARDKSEANVQALEDARAALASAETDLVAARAEHEVCAATAASGWRAIGSRLFKNRKNNYCSKLSLHNATSKRCAIAQRTHSTWQREHGTKRKAR